MWDFNRLLCYLRISGFFSEVAFRTAVHTITVTWRLSGRVKVGPGFDIKPYLVFTDFRVDPRTGLVAFQEDRFSLPGWDLLLSALLPPLRPWLAPPAPPADILRTDQSLAGP